MASESMETTAVSTNTSNQDPPARGLDLYGEQPQTETDPALADDEAIARALSMIEDYEVSKTIPEKRQSSSAPPVEAKKARRESFDDILLRLTNEFTPVVEHDWDTLIYIGPPPQEHGQDDDEYQYIRRHFSKPYLMNSKTLRDTGSAHFAKLLGPTSARAQRKLKKLGVHHNLPGDRSPTYFIDLRPPQDDDDAVLMITEMECTNGILTWHSIAKDLGIDRAVIGGKDRLNTTRSKREISAVDDASMPETAAQAIADSAKTLSDDVERGYSALRHHMAIERLLHTVAGGDPKLNSAPKVWNYFAIAKYLDCLSTPAVKSEILSWLFSGRNSNFVQHNTEVTYRMALGLKAQDLTRVTFAALVGNQAWLQTFRDQHLSANSMKQPVGVLKHLDDDEVNRIDHAAQSFLYKVRSTFDKVANDPMSWMVRSTEMLKLIALRGRDEEATALISQTQDQLVALIRGEIYRALSQNLSESQLSAHVGAAKCFSRGIYDGQHISADVYNQLSLPQRLIMQAFWTNLKTYGFYQETVALKVWQDDHSLMGGEKLAPDLLDLFSLGETTMVTKEDVAASIDELNDLMYKRTAYYWDHKKPVGMIRWSDLAVAASRNASTRAAFDVHRHVAGIDHTAIPPSQDRMFEQSRELTRAMQHLSLNASERREAKSLYTGLVSKSQVLDELPETMLLTRDAPSRWRNLPTSAATEDNYWITHRINKPLLLSELSVELRKIIESEILTPGWANDEMGVENELPIDQVDTLLCLDDTQWKYLPMWAGGCDDGTGGVFLENHVPDMGEREGFQGGKRGLGKDEGLDELQEIEMGEGGAYSVIDGNSDFEDIKTEEALSTVGRASHLATDGTRSSAVTVMSLDE